MKNKAEWLNIFNLAYTEYPINCLIIHRICLNYRYLAINILRQTCNTKAVSI